MDFWNKLNKISFEVCDFFMTLINYQILKIFKSPNYEIKLFFDTLLRRKAVIR